MRILRVIVLHRWLWPIAIGVLVVGAGIVFYEIGELVKDWLLGKWESSWQRDTFDE